MGNEFDDIFAQALDETAETDENFVLSNNYKVYQEYVDMDGTVFISDQRKINVFDDQTSIQGESDAQYIVFEMGRYYNGIDLSTKNIQIHYERPDGEGDNSAPVNVMVSDNKIRFGWIIPIKATEVSGRLKVMPFVYGESPVDDSEIYIMKSLYVEYTIHTGLSIDGGIKKKDEWYNQFLVQMMDYVKQVQTNRDQTKSYRDEVYNMHVHIVDLVDNISDIDYTVSEIVQYRDQARVSEANAKKYADQALEIVSGVGSGGLIPAGTISFSELPESPTTGALYNMSDGFTTDDRFLEGAGHSYKKGTNIYFTAQGKWDVLEGVPVTKDDLGLGKVENKTAQEILGELTKDDVTGALGYIPPEQDTDTTYSPMTGATSTQAGTGGLVPAPAAGSDDRFLNADGTWKQVSIPDIPDIPDVDIDNHAVTFVESITRENIETGDTIKELFGKIKRWYMAFKNVAFTGSYSDLTDKPDIPTQTKVKAEEETTYKDGNVNITREGLGLGNVENKSSATIRSEITSQNVVNALGFTPSEGGGSVDVDMYLSNTSNNSVANSVISKYLGNLVIPDMVKFNGRYLGGNFELIWEEPEGVDKVVIVRKQNTAPQNLTDGTVVMTINKSNFGQHKDSYYKDTANTAALGSVFIYKAFPVIGDDFFNSSDKNQKEIKAENVELYSITIDNTVSDPAQKVMYGDMCEGYTPFSITRDNTGKQTGYSMGSWGSAFFLPKVCVQMYDGTVAYRCKREDVRQKEDGTASNVLVKDTTNWQVNGLDANVMVEFPKVYIKVEELDENGDRYKISFCDKKLDEEFECFAHIDKNGNEIPYFYFGAFESYARTVNSVRYLLSLYGQAVKSSGTAPANAISIEINGAKNIGEDYIPSPICDRILIDYLLLLIGKSTDSQGVFGVGFGVTTSSGVSNKVYATSGASYGSDSAGTGNYGLFGCIYSDGKYSCRVFGIENYWGNCGERVYGSVIGSNGNYLVKMTEGTYDGSTVTGYENSVQNSGQGFIDTGIPYSIANITGNYCIKRMKFTKYGYFAEELVSASAMDSYFCDSMQISYDVSYVNARIVSGNLTTGLAYMKNFGMFYHKYYYNESSNTCRLCCKPRKVA